MAGDAPWRQLETGEGGLFQYGMGISLPGANHIVAAIWNRSRGVRVAFLLLLLNHSLDLLGRGIVVEHIFLKQATHATRTVVQVLLAPALSEGQVGEVQRSHA